ncbi:hypothetical protein J2Z43_001230 [Clostridioides mangenotii]|uniref:Uncharacterized protein n=1 Tax=Metaclostridioides mangenotii TaxID=1540 RepID=A0ABS4EA81_9FIRM|nr:hypothetical protein [Clostridioides mangenotii]
MIMVFEVVEYIRLILNNIVLLLFKITNEVKAKSKSKEQK